VYIMDPLFEAAPRSAVRASARSEDARRLADDGRAGLHSTSHRSRGNGQYAGGVYGRHAARHAFAITSRFPSPPGEIT